MRRGIFNRRHVSIAAMASAALFAPGSALARAPADESGPRLDEIIVTASKRDVNIQKESRAITAIGAAELARQGVVDPASVQNLAPGLTIARNGQQLQVSIRGVGDRTVNNATDPAVAINVDGIYYPKSYEASAAFFDLERIEVLKGPQGTLYGRNASSGAINLITAKPKFETSGFAELEVGNYGNQRGTAALNFALSDMVAIRVSGQAVDRQGFLSDGYNDNINQAGRAQLLIGNGDTSLLLSASFSHLGGKGDAGVIAHRFGSTPSSSPVADPANAYAGPTDPATLARVQATNPGAEALPRGDGFQDINVYVLSAAFQTNLGFATLNVTPSYVGSTYENLSYAALVVPTWGKTKSNQFALETRLTSPVGSRVKWVVGAFGSAEDVNDQYQSKIAAIFGLPAYAPKRDDRTWAVFGEANFSITDQLRVIGGIRYTWERKNVVGATAAVFGPIPVFPIPFTVPISSLPGASDISGTRVDKATNFRAGAEYDISPEAMIYATVATGFKAGGFYNDVAPSNSYKPEKLTAYSAGWKSRFLDNRIQFNVEGFYWKYHDKQETFLGFGSVPGSVILLTQNAASATLYGADVSLAGQVTSTTRVTGEVEYNHTNYDKYVVSTLFGPIDNTGRQLVRAPEWSGRVAIDQTLPISGLGKFVVNAAMRFSGSYWLQNDFTPIERQSSFQVFDASLSWSTDDDRYTITGFAKNIGKQVYYSQGIQAPSLSDAVVGSIGDPQTYGVRLRAKF